MSQRKKRAAVMGIKFEEQIDLPFVKEMLADKTLPDASYVQDNSLIESCYAMTIRAKRLVAIAISKISPTEMPDSQYRVIEIKAADWIKTFDDTGGWRSLRTACDELLKTHVEVKLDEEKYMKVNWVESVKYFPDEGIAFLRFTDPIFNRLTGLRQQFTVVDLRTSGKLRRFYSVRLFELCMQFKKVGSRTIKIDDLRRIMECENIYPRTGDFVKTVVTDSVKEINKKTNFSIEVDTIYSGKSIDRFTFRFAPKTSKDSVK